MIVRKKKNKSGSVSLQIITKHRGRYAAVKSIGSAKGEQAIAVLVEQGNQEVLQLQGQQGLFVFEKDANEIPVIDVKTKQVWYDIDALLEIFDQKIPCIKTAGRFAPVRWTLNKLCKLISYNRKVIVAARPTGDFDFSPNFNFTYRVLLLIIGFTFNTYMLFPYAQTIFSNSFVDESTITQLQKSHLLFVLINIGCAFSLKMKTGLEYLGQVNMLALICILIMMPLHFLNSLLPINSLLNNIYLAALALYLVYAYSRRMKYAGIIKNHPAIICINILSEAIIILYLSS